MPFNVRQPPRTWMYFVRDCLDVEEYLAVAWWHALCRSSTPSVQILRQNFSLASTLKLTPKQLLLRTARPAVLIEVIESLVAERLLTRRFAVGIEERIFARIRMVPSAAHVFDQRLVQTWDGS